MNETDAIRYPIGKCTLDFDSNSAKRSGWIANIRNLPVNLRASVASLSDKQLNECYRAGGWKLRQVVHHLADEHLNAFAYFKMALTENDPVIKQYDEPAWAETPDASTAPVELSLDLLTALHSRWALLLDSLDDRQFARAYIHRRGRLTLDHAIQLYSWHSMHHTAHIVSFRDRAQFESTKNRFLS